MWAKKWIFLLVELCDLSRNAPQFKIASYHSFTKSRCKKDGPHFSQATRNWKHRWCTTQPF